MGFHTVFRFNCNIFAIALTQQQELKMTSSKSQSIQVTDGSTGQQMKKCNSLSDKSLELLSTVIKHSLLGMLMISCSVFMFLYTVIGFWLYEHNDIDMNVRVSLFYWMLCITLIIVTFCMYLGFASNDKIYKCLCKKCHAECHRLCQRMAEKKMIH